MTTFTCSSKFPENFVFGVAAVSAQIEGAAFADGRASRSGDHFARIPGKVVGGDNLDVACDHYNRFDKTSP